MRSIDVQGGGAPQEGKGGDESDEPEAVVAVQVGDEDVVDAGEFEPAAAQLHLDAFGAVDHEEFLTDVDDL